MRRWWQGLRGKGASADGAAVSEAVDVDAAAKAQAARRRGNAALGEGRIVEATQCYRDAVDADPSDALAHVNLGYTLLEQRQPSAAAELLRRALTLRSADGEHLPDAWFLLAQSHEQIGEPAGAIDAYQAALRARPAFAEAMHALVPLLLVANRNGEALDCARRLEGLQPSPAARVLLAHAHYAAGQDKPALDLLDTVLREHPDHEGALAGRGHALLRLGDHDGAAETFRRALDRHGVGATRLINLAAALHRQGGIDESADLALQALRIDPLNAAALNLRVVNLTERLRLAEAEAVAREALGQHPDDADLHWSLGVALLLQGRLREGWPEHHWRWRTSAMAATAPVPRAEPVWRGEPLEGRSLLLVAEQGFGDMIQFVRYVPRLSRLAGRVLVQAPPALQPLLRSLPAHCEMVSPTAQVRADLHCALMDVPDVLGLDPADAHAPLPYLQADPERIAHWKERLRADGAQRLKVGIVCSGNPAHTNDRQRSIPLEQWAPLLACGARFVSLQPQLRPADLHASAALPLNLEPARELHDFAETAALLEALDLVITVDTSVAHLAGALARPVWILLPHCPDWRWMLDRADSPWYPTARLFRQPARGDWGAVIASVTNSLRDLEATVGWGASPP